MLCAIVLTEHKSWQHLLWGYVCGDWLDAFSTKGTVMVSRLDHVAEKRKCTESTYLNSASSFDPSAASSALLMYALPAPAAPLRALSLSGDSHVPAALAAAWREVARFQAG